MTAAPRDIETRIGKSQRLVPDRQSGYTTSIVGPYSLLRVGFFAIAVAALAGCAGPAVSPTDQTLIKEADQLHARLEAAVVENQEPRLKRYFEQLANRIVTAARELDQQGIIQSRSEGSNDWMFSKDIDFHLLNSELPNAYTSGGRHVYIYDGLFQLCRSEDELASLFCHEYAHVYGRHVQKELKRDTTLGGEDGLLLPFVALKFTPAHERTADTIAFNIFAKAGWDPARFGDLYRRLLQEGPRDGLDQAFLRQSADTARELPKGAQNWAQPPVADDARFAQLQAETRAVVAAAALRNPRVELLLAAFPGCLTPPDSAAQTSARQRLFPPPAGPSENKWNKGLQGAR